MCPDELVKLRQIADKQCQTADSMW